MIAFAYEVFNIFFNFYIYQFSNDNYSFNYYHLSASSTITKKFEIRISIFNFCSPKIKLKDKLYYIIIYLKLAHNIINGLKMKIPI